MPLEFSQQISGKVKKKRQRWSKNKKKNWSKKIDISEIEDALDKKRLESRTGGPIEDKKDEELFIIEKIPSTLNPSIYKARKKVLMVDKVLGVRDEVKKPIQKKSIKKKWEKKKKPQKDSPVVTDPNGPKNFDLWSSSADKVSEQLFKVSSVAKHTQEVIGKNKKPEHMMKAPKAIFTTAVEVAHPGSSYNPTFDDHQNLLAEEYEKEALKMKKEIKIQNAVYVDPSEYVTVEIAEKELKEGLFDKEEDVKEEESENEELYSSVTVPKTRKRRKKEMEQKMLLRKKEEMKAKNRRENEVFRTKTLLDELKKEKVESLKRIEKRNQVQKQPQLSYMKFEKPDQDLQLSEEIEGSLRKLKPEGNILFDRYKSFQHRCIIEPRKRFKPAKRSHHNKYQEKRSFREITL